MNIPSLLIIIAAFLIATGTCLLGSVLFLNSSISNLTEETHKKQNLYREIRRQMDRASELYEISRIFTSFARVDQKINPNLKDVTLHEDSYIAVLKQSESSAFNAAYGSARDEEEQKRAKVISDEKMPQGRNVEQIHKNIFEFVPIANERCNVLHQEIKDLDN